MAEKIITPEAILSYPNLIEPRADDAGKLWYSAVLIFLPDTDITIVKQGIIECAREQFGAKADDMLRTGKLKSPLRKDWEAKGYPKDSVFFSCKSKSKPGFVTLTPGPDGKPLPYDGEIYPGMFVRASVRPYYYTQQGGGIAFGLGNLQKLRDGERMDGRLPAEDEFEADANAAAAAANADLSDIL